MAEQPSPFDSERAPVSVITGSGAQNGAPPVDERAAFLHAMAHAMQETLTDARTRVAEDVERRRAAHIAAIHARREAEVSRIHEFADDDRKAIGMWAASERLRIQFERERRTAEVDADLESSLAEHRSRIDREIESAEAAFAAHRADLDAYFATLRRLTDPVAIAQYASRRPPFPTIETIAGGSDTVSPNGSKTEAPDTVAAQFAQEQPAARTTLPAEEAIPDDAPAVAVMDELALKRAKWWAMWTALPERPAVLETVGAATDPNESKASSASS